LIEAYAASEVAAPLVIAGAHRDGVCEVRQAIEREGVEDRVQLIGRVSDDDLAALYAGCRMFVYPSRYEGFGLPVVEAMARGASVSTSAVSSMPEVAGDAALLVAPSRTASIAAALRRLDWDEERRQELRRRAALRARHFSWAKTAESTMAAYGAAL